MKEAKRERGGKGDTTILFFILYFFFKGKMKS